MLNTRMPHRGELPRPPLYFPTVAGSASRPCSRSSPSSLQTPGGRSPSRRRLGPPRSTQIRRPSSSRCGRPKPVTPDVGSGSLLPLSSAALCASTRRRQLRRCPPSRRSASAPRPPRAAPCDREHRSSPLRRSTALRPWTCAVAVSGEDAGNLTTKSPGSSLSALTRSVGGSARR